ncbi:MAG: DedA family protein [Nitrospiraceae bacterium]|nr:DedA family protein [Nitrospiraceae bacterium]
MVELSSMNWNWVHGLLNHFPVMGLFVLLVLGGLGLPFPEDAILILCGIFIATGIARPAIALSASYAGLLSMDFFLYYVGRKYGAMLVGHKRFRRIITQERLLKLEEKFSRWGVLFLITGRQLVGLRAQIFLVSGVLRMPFLKFIAVDMAGALITMSIMVGIGYAGGSSLEVLSKDINKIGHLAVALGVVFIFFYLFYKYIKRGRTPD